MKTSDYIIEYLINRGITDVFGYPGGMVTHLMDSFSKYSGYINAHMTYHEQGAAFAACGYAQISGNVGVAYATSGPGATNLITGICNAYFDSIPTLFITGQVNTFESKGTLGIRQRGFQETDIVSMINTATKYAVRVQDARKIKWHLDYAFAQATGGRKGPVLLDIPMNIFRAEILPDTLEGYVPEEDMYPEADILPIQNALMLSKRPVLLLGNGIKTANAVDIAREMVEKLSVPAASTMIAVDVLAESKYNCGFIGAYGSRAANLITSKSDLVITLGARLDVRQVGAKRENFAPNARIIRIDIDDGELGYKVHDDELQIRADVCHVMSKLTDWAEKSKHDFSDWLAVCDEIKEKLELIDERKPNALVRNISGHMPEESIITTDVGQNQIWVAQSGQIKKHQKLLFSGGHGAMGYSLPAAIGASLASGKTVFSFNGDGGIQMNIQELQTIAREHLPIKIILMNNFALGMIRHFQEMYFEANYYQTTSKGGYTVPDFGEIASAYGLEYKLIKSEDDIEGVMFDGTNPCLIEVRIQEDTYVYPKLEYGKPNQDQEPLLERMLYEYLSNL